MVLSLVFHSRSELLEGPVFNQENNLHYFVTILDYLVNCYNPATKELPCLKLDSPVRCIFLLGNRKVLDASKNGFFKIDFNTVQKQFVFQIKIDGSVRCNDRIKDSAERISIGTMEFPEVKARMGKVFSYHQALYKTLIGNTTLSNGLTLSREDNFLHFIDTPSKKVANYFYDLGNDEAVFDSYVIEFKDKGSLDGTRIDSEGMLWITEWGGGCVSKRNLSKRKLKKSPCSNVTSGCFDYFSNLYVTATKYESINLI